MGNGTQKRLRTGFTTGSCATAGSKAALIAIMSKKTVDSVEIRIPRGDRLNIKIARCTFSGSHATCSVIKDGGDDPDVTHGAEIVVDLEITPDNCGQIEIGGGRGVGTVTKPGLGLELNKHAINPVPKRMIVENLTEVGQHVLQKSGIRVTISVPRGEELAPKTDNPRLGILGGISILGTSGIVIPFSTASYAASIRQNLDVAIAAGERTVVLTTGGRSEEFSKRIVQVPDHCFIQMGDFSGYTIQQCSKKGIERAYVVGFIGKLAKMAAGVKQTHVKGSKVDMKFLAGLAEQCGAAQPVLQQILGANTARHVSEIVREGGVDGFFQAVCDCVCRQMHALSEGRVLVGVALFDFDGSVLAKSGPASVWSAPR